MDSKPEREVVVGFAKYMRLGSFGNFLLNSKAEFVTNLNNYLSSFHLNTFYNQKENTIIDYVPNVFYTPVKERKEYILLTSDGCNIASCILDDRPRDKPT